MTKRPESRGIRSFVLRAGRTTPAQRRALERLWPVYGLDYRPEQLDLEAVFGRRGERVLEIGFGDGESLLEEAALRPEVDFLGVEVHRPGVGHCLLAAKARSLHNLRVICHDAMDVLQHQLPETSLARVNLYFPDPWPKKRHHKRRIFTRRFLELVASRLRPGGRLYVATDWASYAEQIDELTAPGTAFTLHTRRAHRGERPLDRPTTKFERRGLALGHTIVDWRLDRA